MASVQSILGILTTLMSIILLIVQIKASEEVMGKMTGKVLHGLEDWAHKHGLSQTWIAKAVGRGKATVGGWFSGTGIRDFADILKVLRENLTREGHTAALQDLDKLVEEAPIKHEAPTVASEKADYPGFQRQLELYSNLEGLEQEVRVLASVRAENFNAFMKTRKFPAGLSDHNNTSFEKRTMPAYRCMAGLLRGDQRSLLEPSTHQLIPNFLEFLEKWEWHLDGVLAPDIVVKESTAEALYDDVRVHRALISAKLQSRERGNLSLHEIMGLIQGADVQLDSPFLQRKIAEAEGPFENCPYHSSHPPELAQAYSAALEHALKLSFLHHNFNRQKKGQALHLLHPRFYQALSKRLRAQYENHAHHNYTFQRWLSLVSTVEHALVGF